MMRKPSDSTPLLYADLGSYEPRHSLLDSRAFTLRVFYYLSGLVEASMTRLTMPSYFLSVGLLLLTLSLGAQPLIEALEAAPFPRLAERQAVQRMTLKLGMASADQAETQLWFTALRASAQRVLNPGLKAFLEVQLTLDPSLKPGNLRAPFKVVPTTHEPGQGALADLVAAQRAFELGLPPPLTVAQLVAASQSDTGDLARRALKLLRRQDAATAAPLLWQRLLASKRRSDVLDWEDELLRLPLTVVHLGFPLRAERSTAKPARAAWLRVLAVRPTLRADDTYIFPLLSGPADEVTEAAWEAVPQIFTIAELARLETVAAGLSERLAPRAREAIQRLR